LRAIYPGSFDPITNGHIDIIERSADKFDKITVAVLNNKSKNAFFNVDEKMDLIRQATKHIKNIEVDSFTGLLIEYAKKKDINVIIRGLRAVSDYEYEMQMALANRKLYADLETFFMVSSTEYSFLSSSIVREVSYFGGDIAPFVPKYVEEAIHKKLMEGI